MNKPDIRKIRALSKRAVDKKLKSDNRITCRAWVARIDNQWYWGGNSPTYRLTT